MKTVVLLAVGLGLGVAGIYAMNKVRFGKFTLGGF